MALIKLKFSPEMEELVLQGKKCCTTRDEKKGEVGDVFRLKGDRLYRIIEIEEITIGLGSLYYKQEGFESSQRYRECIDFIYPGISRFYLHWFQYFDSGCRDFGYSGSCMSKEICKVGEYCSKKKWAPL